MVLSAMIGVAADPVAASLKKFSIRRTYLTQEPGGNLFPSPGVGDAVIEASSSLGVTRLVHLALVTDQVGTVCCGGGSAFAFVSLESREGPSPNQTGSGAFTSTIAWGVVTGWSITGSFYCHSIPVSICAIASGMDLATVDPPLLSPFYDLGTWSFHATGFTATPFISNYLTTPPGGNQQWILRGRHQEHFLPLLPAAGVFAVAGGLLVLGARRSRRSA
jgi:hypothetical protein